MSSSQAAMREGSGPDGPVDVSVVVPTYNHERYVARSIESVLAQRGAGTVEIIVSEDASTDGTAGIVEAIRRAYPERIRSIVSPVNLRSNEVIARGLRASRGRYVAVLDGDDFWIDEDRLRRQTAFLDTHPDCALVFGNALVAHDDVVSDRRWTPPGVPARATLDRLWEGNPYATSAALMRAEPVRAMPSWYSEFLFTDWPLYVACAQRGSIAFVDEPVSVYRLHGGGMHSALPDAKKLDIVEEFYRRAIAHIAPSFRPAARRGCALYFLQWAEVHAGSGERAAALDCVRRALRTAGAPQALRRRAMMRTMRRLLRRPASAP